MRDILEAIDRIERYTAQGRDAFDRDELVQTWIVHHLLIIGEAVAALPPEIRDRASRMPWRQITGMRNVLVHHYFESDREVVWTVVEQNLPGLQRDIATLLDSLTERP